MDGEAIMTVSAAVVALTQLLKWAGIEDRYGPGLVLLLSLFGVGFFVYAREIYTRRELFDYFAAWIAVATSAAGVFGFTRAAQSAVTSARNPPPGAGASPTVQD